AAAPAGMSRKQAARARPAASARKGRRPRHPPAGPAPGPASGDRGGLAGQLRALGLKLREVPGDGNCLFRALGDQLEGHSRNHLRHRQETVEYMVRQRGDFEPFVEDDVPFDKHVANLAKPGTFAGNDAIVAFARNNQMNVVIHQLNAPLWQIRGTDRSDARELHIAYRYGEHYDSVRRIDDDSEAPAHLRMEMLCKNNSNKAEEVKPQKGDSEDETEVEVEDAVQKVCSATGCSDIDLVSHVLEVEDYNVESAIFAILQVKEGEGIGTEEQQEPLGREQKSCSRTLWEENGTGSRILGNQNLHQGETETNKGRAGSREENRASRNPKVAKKQRKEQQRLEKKKRQEERHRQKVLAAKRDSADNRTETDPANQVTLVKAVAALNI
ncbi:OTUD3 protein, partial [Dicrurus megarhynchus]|nr:OTUD3 protein [Dicrurus megarhynchus]